MADLHNSSPTTFNLFRSIRLPCSPGASPNEYHFISPFPSLTPLRLHVLESGGKILSTSSSSLQRGFLILDPRRIPEDKFEEAASSLDRTEKEEASGNGKGYARRVTLADLKEDGIKVGICITSASAARQWDGVMRGDGSGMFDLTWAVLRDLGLLDARTRVVSVVGDGKILNSEDEVVYSENEDSAEEFALVERKEWDVTANEICTPREVLEVIDAAKPEFGVLWDKLKEGMMERIPPLQELKGIQLMESIMKNAAPVSPVPALGGKRNAPEKIPEADETMAINMVERIMRGYTMS